ncbi:MAG: protein tyrosine phosphatase family protein [Proteobacteria bacterium]|nr:protein tyrosine phosphatase family protein [Pseudomonadota bacterium]
MRRLGRLVCIFAFAGLGIAVPAMAQSPDSITNYSEYSKIFSSSGQPTEAQLGTLQENHVERVIYLAYSDHESSLVGEDRIVKNLGMDYVHLPVAWEAPGKNDFYMFAAIMEQAPEKKTLLHCQVNFRASAFSFLYRVIYQDVSLEDAKEDMNSVWAPNETWRKLIFEVLLENDISPHCDVCDWEVQ